MSVQIWFNGDDMVDNIYDCQTCDYYSSLMKSDPDSIPGDWHFSKCKECGGIGKVDCGQSFKHEMSISRGNIEPFCERLGIPVVGREDVFACYVEATTFKRCLFDYDEIEYSLHNKWWQLRRERFFALADAACKKAKEFNSLVIIRMVG